MKDKDPLFPDQSSDRQTSGRARRGLLALGSAAVLAVYSAGYVRTRAAAERFAAESERRPLPPSTRVALGTERVAAARDTATHDSGRSSPGPARHARVERATGARDSSKSANTQVSARDQAAIHVPAGEIDHATTGASGAGSSRAKNSDSVVASAMSVLAPRDSLARESSTAPTQVPDTATSDSAAAVAWKDGFYSGWGSSRHGDIEASVEIRDGRIVAASITQCLTRYSCSWIAALPPQVVSRQSPEVDYVSGATQSTNAFYYAIVEALSKAK